MVNSIQRDKRRRLLFSQFEREQVQHKTLLQDISLKAFYKQAPEWTTNKIPRSSSITRVRNRCILTGRGRSVLRVCKISRIRLRELASKGVLNGVSKASW